MCLLPLLFILFYMAMLGITPRECGLRQATEGIPKALSARIRRMEGPHVVSVIMLCCQYGIICLSEPLRHVIPYHHVP